MLNSIVDKYNSYFYPITTDPTNIASITNKFQLDIKTFERVKCVNQIHVEDRFNPTTTMIDALKSTDWTHIKNGGRTFLVALTSFSLAFMILYAKTKTIGKSEEEIKASSRAILESYNRFYEMSIPGRIICLLPQMVIPYLTAVVPFCIADPLLLNVNVIHAFTILGLGAITITPFIGIDSAMTGACTGFALAAVFLSGIAISQLGKGLISGAYHFPRHVKETLDSANIEFNENLKEIKDIDRREKILIESLKNFKNMQQAMHDCRDLDAVGLVGHEIYENSIREISKNSVH